MGWSNAWKAALASFLVLTGFSVIPTATAADDSVGWDKETDLAVTQTHCGPGEIHIHTCLDQWKDRVKELTKDMDVQPPERIYK